MIQIRNASLTFGHQTVFDDITLTINDTDRIGLVGLNGSGKSTLLKAIAGSCQLDEGTISTISSKTFAYLPQHVVLESDKTILDEAFAGHEPLWQLERERRELERASADDHAAGSRLAEVTEELHALDADNHWIEVHKTLRGLGFTEAQLHAKVSTLSVGWKMRVVLAKLLLQKADFYLFDEPTNHLDIVAKDWFLSFLKDAPFGFLLVCHERYFLNQLCSEIIELEFGNATRYRGNYSKYETQKEHNLQELAQAAKQQQKDIARKKATIARFRAKANKSRMAKSMQKALNKVEVIQLPPSAKQINITLPAPKQRAGKTVLTVKQVAHAFGKKQIFNNASFTIHRGERVALIAPNGVGKTTLFNIVTGHYPLQNGSVEFGHNVDPVIFHQDQDAWLNKNNTILDEVMESAPPQKTPEQARTLLGCFLFGSNDSAKKISVLSGGEKNRVSMVKVLLQDANLLFLDEPTNHLDIPSKDILLKALKNYQGTLLFVSHDHDFINQLATRVIALDANGTKAYHGNYTDYKNAIAEFRPHAPLIPPCPPKLHAKAGSESRSDLYRGTSAVAPEELSRDQVSPKTKTSPGKLYELKKTSKKLEHKIAKLEASIQKIQNSFADLQYGTPEFEEQDKKLREFSAQLEATFVEWETLQQQLES